MEINPISVSVLVFLIIVYFSWIQRNDEKFSTLGIATKTALVVIGIGFVMFCLSMDTEFSLFFFFGMAVFFIALIGTMFTSFVYSIVVSPISDTKSVARANEVLNAFMFIIWYGIYSVNKIIDYSY